MPDFSRRPYSRTSSKAASSRPPSAFENNIDYFREPVVKSPPEPTRVRSPESVMRSPDPINWTVPLDTGKTFSITQSVKDGGQHLHDFSTFFNCLDSPESSRHSPLSDHSSLYDSVSGTAINLGSRVVPISLHGSNQRISSLAKEARDLQPGLTKDSTMTRPESHSNDACRNPSIPELCEDNIKGTLQPFIYVDKYFIIILR